MTQPRPKLVAVESLPKSSEPPVDARAGARSAFWVLAALVCVCALAAAFQTQRVNTLRGEVVGLHGEVAGLTGELTQAHAQLDAYQGRMNEIRGSVAQIQDQLRGIDQLALPPANPAP